MSSIDLTFEAFALWYSKWVLFEILKSTQWVPTHIGEGDFHRAQTEISAVMWSEADHSRYRPYSTADPRTVVANTALFIDIHRDNQQWQRQWIRYAVNTWWNQNHQRKPLDTHRTCGYSLYSEATNE